MRTRFGSLAASRITTFAAAAGPLARVANSTAVSPSMGFAPVAVQQLRFCSSEPADDDAAGSSNDRDGKRRGDDSKNRIFFNNPELVLRKPNEDLAKGCMVRVVQEGEFLALTVHKQNKPASEPKHYTGGRSALRFSKVLATRFLAVIEGNLPTCELVTRSKSESVVADVKTNADGTITLSGKAISLPQPGETETTTEFAATFDLAEVLMLKLFLKEYIHFASGFHASGHIDRTRIEDEDDDDDDLRLTRRRDDRRDDRGRRDNWDSRRDDRREYRRDDRRDVRRDDRDRRDVRRDDRRDDRDRREYRRDDRRDDRRRDDRRDNRDDRRDVRRDDRDRRDRRGDDRNKATERKPEATEKKETPTRQYESSIY